jgi:phosphatidylethanolamine-binding protein (PEBP) family uncharacterized protein
MASPYAAPDDEGLSMATPTPSDRVASINNKGLVEETDGIFLEFQPSDFKGRAAIQLRNGDFVAADDTKQPPKVHLWPIVRDDDEVYLTLVVFDPDAGHGKGFVHWIVQNLNPHGQFDMDTVTAVKYRPMHPPAGETHSYHWYWFSQVDGPVKRLKTIQFTSPEQFLQDNAGQLDGVRAHLTYKSG